MARSSPATTALHALWRPGVGLAVWGFDDVALPEDAARLLARRRAGRDVPVLDESGRRRFERAVPLGVASTVALLDALRDTPVSGELRWYIYLLDGVRGFVTAGTVAPGLVDIAGEATMRWLPVPTAMWRAWLDVVIGSAPDFLTDNGGAVALQDLLDEFVDHECRARLATAEPTVATPLIGALLPHTDASAPLATARVPAAQGAWREWNNSAPHDDSTLLLRLYEPDSEDDPDAPTRWRLQVCRRSSDGHVAPIAPHRLDAHDLDDVTSGLARAVRAFPELADADPDRHTLDFLLSTETAETLFAAGAAALGEVGIPVLLPRAIADVRPTLGLRATPVIGSPQRSAVVRWAAIRNFEWRLAIGTGSDAAITLSEADIGELTRQKGDLVRVRGVWMRAEGAALTRAAAFVTAQRAAATSDQPADMGELFDLVAGNTAVPVPISSVEGLSWLDDIAETGALAPPHVESPSTLRATLRPYQLRGLEWLVHLADIGVGGVLADDMGLGKTIQVISLLCHEDRAIDTAPTLIVCPMSVVGNWRRELERFAPHLRVLVHHGPDRHSRKQFTAARDRSDVVLTTFALAARDQELLGEQQWHRLVVDEAQHVKNVNTIAAKALRTLRAEHRIALTGTPVENRLEDLRVVIDLVNPGMLGSASTFRARFAEPIERDRDPATLRRLTALTRPFILRREKTDPAVITDLPEKTELTVRANLTVEQAALYQAILDDLMEALKSKQQRTLRRRTVLAALTRLKQVCNHPAHYLADGTPMLYDGEHRSGKVELLADILGTVVDDGERALVFTQFAEFGHLLTEWLGEQLETPVPLLHGGVGRTARDRMVAQFQDDAGPPVLVATLKAGGTGLNLTAANHVVHVDRWWNPAVEDQATDRAYRIGQQRAVQVRKFVCVGTLEERIDEMIDIKRELASLSVSTGESWLSDLGDDELFDLFRLRDEAVSE
ncbi:SNF2-related protein [Gordonia sp. CPCC 205515]|uniref:DEAD/DEAH box helicase n=1 Tax=Gordonia sp. CPCC 205515 TaxID=3140791 RepID=UPI003AF37ABB